MKIDNVELGKVRPSKTNPRKDFKEAEMVDLTESVRFKGILQPLLVRPSWCIGLDQEAIDKINGQGPVTEFYEIVAGERRFRAAERASLATLPLIVRALSDQETLEIQLIENLQREDLDPFDEAEGYSRLLALRDGHGAAIHTVETIHLRVGKPRRRIYYRLRLQLVPAEVRQAVRDGNLPIDTAELIGSIPAKDLREAAAEQILHPQLEEGPLNRRKARELIADNYMRSLAGAPFAQRDAGLVPVIQDEETGERIGGGACEDCPMRTGNMEASLSQTGQGKTKRPDVCTNPGCFMLKCDAEFARLQTEAVKEGKKLVSEAEAKEIFEDNGSILFDSPFVKLTDKPDPHECPGAEAGAKLPTWAKLLDSVESKPSIHVARDPRGRIVELVDRKLAIEAVKLWHKQQGEKSIFDEGKAGSQRTENTGQRTGAAETNFQKQERKKRDAAKFDLQVTLASLHALFEAIRDTPKPMIHDFWLELVNLSVLHASHDGSWLVCKWLKIEPKANKHNPNAKDFAGAIKQHSENFNSRELGSLATCLLLSQRLKFNGVKDAEFKKLATIFKIDVGEIERSIRGQKTEDSGQLKTKKNLSGGVESSRQAGDTHQAGDGQKTALDRKTLRNDTRHSGSSAPPAQHSFQKIADNKYRCKNCGAFAVKSPSRTGTKHADLIKTKKFGTLLPAKEYRGKPCVAESGKLKAESGKKKKLKKKKSKAKRH